jgi:hypothetical protein
MGDAANEQKDFFAQTSQTIIQQYLLNINTNRVILIRISTASVANDQKENRRANCIMRGFTEVLLITPKVGELKLVSGVENWG